MVFYAASIFISAFLLFLIQPIIGKLILPWFGGTPTVWSTVMVFFQVLLTGGYAYAYWLIERAPEKRRSHIHIFLLGVTVLAMVGLGAQWNSPITPSAAWKPQNIEAPIGNIFKLLLVAVGLPYFMLATNSTLTQAWFGRTYPQRSPYALYALSNVGSLLGLIAYPFLVEPILSLKMQAWVWSGGFLVFAMLAGLVTIRSQRKTASNAEPLIKTDPAEAAEPPTIPIQILWIALSMTASALMLAVTNQITREVAPIPFLWILPLTIYLLSFILTFSGERWYSRPIYALFLVISAIGFLWAIFHSDGNFLWQIILYSFALFVSVMVCHGELYRLRPTPVHLTRFYLLVSVGGALGGIAVSLIAPLIFDGYFELNVAYTLVFVLLAVLTFMRPTIELKKPRLRFGHDVMIGAVALSLGLFTVYYVNAYHMDNLRLVERNFYGIIRVQEINQEEPGKLANMMVHGITVHGIQYLNEEMRALPTTYYTAESGVGLAILNHPKYGNGMHLGMLGLGTGTLATYSKPGDDYRLYEINPVVMNLAEGEGDYFSFLANSKANIHTVLGDARISLERELAESGSNQFDLLVLDTFSSDAIPVHLVTSEAFEIYIRHLAPDGIIAAHISNEHLDLRPVFYQLAQANNLKMVVIQSPGNEDELSFPATWVLLARDGDLFANPQFANRAEASSEYANSPVRVWTDDYSNLFQILR